MKTLFVLLSVALCVGLVWGAVQGRENKKPDETTTMVTASTVVGTSTSTSSASSQTSKKEFLPDEKWVEANISIPKEIPEFIPEGGSGLTAKEAMQEFMFSFEPPYRIRYYEISGFISELVDPNEADLWDESRRFVENLPEEMAVVSFVKYFQIPKETFKKAAEEEVQRFIDSGLEEYLNRLEAFEPYNVDIIYTFDNEIINEYYRRK
jgi:hypothetical protein